MDNTTHHFDILVAKEVGVNAAVILSNLIFWIDKNKANNKHFYEGKYWTYNSTRAFCELFPYLTENQIRTAVDKLIEYNYIIRGNFNKMSYDKTSWFALSAICEKTQIDVGLNTNRSGFKPEPIPDIKQDIKQDNIYDEKESSNHTEEPIFTSTSNNFQDSANLTETYFDVFWKNYPRKIGKGAAIKIWSRIKDKKQTLDSILSALEWQKDSDSWTKDGGQYIPHPSTYLNQIRWEDEAPVIHYTDADKIKDFHKFSQAEFRKKYGLPELIRIGDIVGE